jgi:hypothetical protein
MDKEKNSNMIRISLWRKKPDNLSNDLTPKFNIFKDKNKRQFYNREELLDANDIVKGNSIICNEAGKRASLRRWLIKKRVKYREKQKKKAILKE